MNVDLLKTGGVKNFSVSNAVESHAPSETDGLHACSFGELAQHPEINFFEARLQRRSEITMALLERLIRTPHRSEVASQFGREQFAKSGGFVGFRPAHFRSSAMVGEVVEAETETVTTRIFVEADDVAKGFKLIGPAIGAEAHHFVFIAEFQEAEILGDGAVKKSQRMRERDGAVNVHAVAVSNAPHGAGKIPEAIGGEKSGGLKGRNKKTAGQMSLMMFVAVKFSFCFLRVSVERRGERFGDASKGSENLGAL